MAESIENSFWEELVYSTSYDLVIIGAGFVGLNAALEYKKRRPESRVAILDRGMHSFGASTKNAGFACFGSPSEILSDLKQSSREEVVALIKKRWEGMQFLKNEFGAEEIELETSGSFETFTQNETVLLNEVRGHLAELNDVVEEATGQPDVFKEVSTDDQKNLGLLGMEAVIVNAHEGLLNPALVHQRLLKHCREIDVKVFLGQDVDGVERIKDDWEISVGGHSIHTRVICYCTNAYTKRFFPDIELQKVKNQVYLSGPIEGLKTPLCAHAHQGYIYYRSVGQRLLIGGARFLDEEQQSDDENLLIKSFLEEYAKIHIAGCQDIKFEHKWIGHIAIGNTKNVLMQEVQDNCWIAVRLGGMGVAMGHQIGKEIATLMAQKRNEN